METKLSDEDFRFFLAEIEEASRALAELDIDPLLHNFIGGQLGKIKLAVDEYRFRGVKGLQEAIAGYLGALGLANAELSTSANTEDGKSRLKALLDVCKTGAELLNTAKGVAWVWPHLAHGTQVIAHLLAAAAK